MKLSHLARSSLIIALFFSLDKALGFVRQVLFSRQFSPDQLDIFLTSNNIPDLLSALISGGALGMALIPVLTAHIAQDQRQQAWDIFTRVLNLAFIVTGSIALLIMALAEPLIHNVIAPGFDPVKAALTAELMRLDLAAILIFSISGLAMAGLQSNQHFVLPALAPVLYNVGQIIGASILAPEQGMQLGPIQLPAFGLGLHGLVYGVILGALLHMGIQIPGLLHFGFRWAPVISINTPGVRQVLRLMGPRMVNMLLLHSYFLARDNLASRQPSGAVTALNYGWFLQQLPETLIGTAIAIALLPSLADLFAEKKPQEFADTANRALRAMLALCLPAAALLAAAIEPLAQAVFGFEASHTTVLAWTTRAFLLGLLGHAWLEVAVRSFYAHQDALTPLLAAFVQAASFLALAVVLDGPLGVAGIALADSIAFTTQALLLLVILNRRFPGVLVMRSTLLRAALGAAAAGGVAWLALSYLPLSPLLAAFAGLAAGGLASLPFIWPEIRLLARL